MASRATKTVLGAAMAAVTVGGVAVAGLMVTMPPVVRPGDASGDDAGSVRVDLDLHGATPPAGCTELPQVGMPSDDGGDWPDLGDGPALLCDGWVTVVLDDRLYAWTDDAMRAAA